MQESESVESLSTTTTTTSRPALVNHHHEQTFSLGLDEGLPDGSDTIPSSSSYSHSSAKEGRGGGGVGRLASSSSTGSLIAGCLFSPSSTTANTSGASASSFLFNSSLITPRRKLSMDLDESTQDASDSGYSRGESVSITSSMESSSGLNFSTALEGVLPKPQSSVVFTSSTMSRRTPLGDITNSTTIAPSPCSSSSSFIGRGRPRQLHKAKRSISFPNEDKIKNVQSNGQSPTPQIPCPSPLPFSPYSNHESRRNSLQLINSPLERMSLMSPGVTSATTYSTTTSSSSSSSSKPQFSIGSTPFIFPPPLSVRENSVESDGYSEVFEGDDSSSCGGDSINSLPGQLTSLMSAPFTSNAPSLKKDVPFSLRKPPIHSTPNVQSSSSSSSSSTVPIVVSERLSLVRADSCSLLTRRTSLKRPSPCPEVSNQPRKKKPPLPMMESQSQDAHPNPRSPSPLKGVQLLRSQSCSLGVPQDHFNMYPLSPGSDNGEMIGDHSKMYALPLSKNSSVPDLKCITPKTLADLLREESDDTIEEYTILDCRYPYEYEGGHIRGARNIWDKDSLQQQFFTTPEYTAETSRRVIIFHCEFSTKRGPEMSRFMRKLDRKRNDMAFPKLYYPELYLLEGGYKAFYERFPELCEPNCYVKMVDENHKEELRHFKQRSKSWTSGEAGTCKRRGSKLRPRRSTIDSHTQSKQAPPHPTPIIRS